LFQDAHEGVVPDFSAKKEGNICLWSFISFFSFCLLSISPVSSVVDPEWFIQIDPDPDWIRTYLSGNSGSGPGSDLRTRSMKKDKFLVYLK
jgi:hypothetical protein